MNLPGAGVVARLSVRWQTRHFRDPLVARSIMYYSSKADHSVWLIREISNELSKDLDGPDQLIIHTLLERLEDPLSDEDDVEIIVKHLLKKLKKE